jgi:atypical dual specificity phosphatase
LSSPEPPFSAGEPPDKRLLGSDQAATEPADAPAHLDTFHWAFDRLYPAIRFTRERVLGHEWFSLIEPGLWLGGAPSAPRDLRWLLDAGVTAILDLRAERFEPVPFYASHGIAHRRYRVPDIAVPGPDVLSGAADWIVEQVADGRTVLVHCAKGRGRSAAVLAGYLMRERGMTFDEARDLLHAKRDLVKLEDRHRRVLEPWAAGRSPTA